MYLRWLAVLILLAAQTAFGVALGVTKVGVASSTTTTATITWTTTGTTASADSRVAYSCAGGAIVNVVQGARVTSHSVTLTNIPAGALCTYTVSSQNATETATATAQTFRTCFPSAGKNTQTNATLYTFYAYGSYTLTWHDLSGIGGTPKQCGASITTPLSGTLDQNGNLSVAVPDVNQVTPSPGKWTFAFSSFAKTGAVSVDIAPTGGNYNATSTVQAAIAAGNKGPAGGSSSQVIVAGANGALQTWSSITETMVLDTGAAFTDSTANLLPANSVIDAVLYRITDDITTSSNFTIGDATTAARFCSTQSTLTAGTTGVCFLQADQTGAPGPIQASAAKLRITLDMAPGAGTVEVVVLYHTWTAPTS